jgi:hypothetical protein
MTIYAQSLIRRAVDTSQDNTSIRWPLREFVRYLNDGQREIVLYRPDAMSTNANITCVAGTKQSIPAAGTKLIEVLRNNPSNTTAGGRAVRLTNREILDAGSPSWHTLTGVAEILHYMYDPRDPKVFYVYPPATTAAKLDIVYSSNPTDIAIPADGASLPADATNDNTSSASTVVGTISVPDIYANALVDYMLYRAYSKDADYAGNAARAQAHYAVFANTLGIEIKATLAVAPTSQSNPNVARAAQAQ